MMIALWLKFIVFGIVLFQAFISFSQEQSSAEFNFYTSWVNMYSHIDLLEDSPTNPGNRVLQWPKRYLYSEIRPNFKMYSLHYAIVFRPRLREEAYVMTREDSQVSDIQINRLGSNSNLHSNKNIYSRLNAYINEAYAQFNLYDSLMITYGIQNYQWGPAESYSPSNKIFTDSTENKGLVYEALGKYLFRINYTMAQYFSVVGMCELFKRENNAKSVFNKKESSEENFVINAILKTEIAWERGSNYLGIVLGGKEHFNPWIGEYLNLTLPYIEGLSFYADLSHQKGSYTYYPDEKTYYQTIQPIHYVVLEQTHKNSDKIFNEFVLGIKYDFEQGSIVRLEYIQNDLGYTKTDYKLIMDSLSNKTNPIQLNYYKNNLKNFYLSNLNLYGKRYLYLSLYSPDLLDIKDLNLYIKNLFSLDDDSDLMYLSLEYAVSDNVLVGSSVSQYLGKNNSFLKKDIRANYALSYKYNF